MISEEIEFPRFTFMIGFLYKFKRVLDSTSISFYVSAFAAFLVKAKTAIILLSIGLIFQFISFVISLNLKRNNLNVGGDLRKNYYILNKKVEDLSKNIKRGNNAVQ